MKTIEVSAAAIFNQQGLLFIAQRAADAHQGGLWEFPGGKSEVGETPEDALIRELYEEIGISCDSSHLTPLIRIEHNYPDKSVVLNVFKVLDNSGLAHGKEGQPVRWIELSNLGQYDFPAANEPIIQALLLSANIKC
jgi:8-oxo-dGTP diphosphatase